MIVILVTIVLSIRLLDFVDDYAVNVLFSDQWDFCTPLFEELGWWEIFSRQHGPHRQGIGFVLTAALYHATDWNTVAESYYIAALLILSTICLLFLRRQFPGPLDLYDLVIPILCLSLIQFETIVLTPNSSHSIFPLLLLSLLGILWVGSRGAIRHAGSAVLAVLLLFTGFGFFAVPLVIVLFVGAFAAAEGGTRCRDRAWIYAAIAFIALACIVFMSGYQTDGGSEVPAMQSAHPWEYSRFVALMFSYLFQIGAFVDHPLALYLFGYSCLLCVVAVFVCSFVRTFRSSSCKALNGLIFLFAGFTILYVFAAAVGRIYLGVWGCMVSRYMTLVLPAVLACYFQIRIVRNDRIRHVTLSVILVFVLCCQPALHTYCHQEAAVWKRGKQAWIRTYMATESIEEARNSSNFWIYPLHTPAVNIEGRLQYLRERKLNLFLDAHSADR